MRRVGVEIKPNFSFSHKPGYILMSPFLLTWSQGFHVIPIVPLGMHSGYHSPSQMQDVLKLLLSAAIPCTKLL